jgi:hypothetical protein
MDVVNHEVGHGNLQVQMTEMGETSLQEVAMETVLNIKLTNYLSIFRLFSLSY